MWLPVVDQTTPQSTPIAPILLDAGSRANFLFQISNGGGSFDVTFGFQTGTPVTVTISGGDWFGGTLPGVASIDSGLPAANLSLTERTVDLSGSAGLELTSITFSNPSNTNAGYAIVAANVSGCLSCPNSASIVNYGGGVGPLMSTTSNGNLGCDLDWTVTGATPNAPLAFIALGIGQVPTPLSLIFPGCTGTVHAPSPIANLVLVDGTGSATLTVAGPVNPSLCGVLVTGQYAELQTGACPVLLGDALGITLGN